MQTQQRIIEIFMSLLNQEALSTKDIAEKYQISLRSAQRDFKAVRLALENRDSESLQKQANQKYQLKADFQLTAAEIYALAKILLASRSFNQKEFEQILKHLLSLAPVKQQPALKQAILNENFYKVSIHREADRLEKIWQLEQLIQQEKTLAITYHDHETQENVVVKEMIFRPVSIFFDNFYFFVVGLVPGENQYQTLHVDWLTDYQITDQVIEIPRAKRYQHGMERPVTAFGYLGKKTVIQFEYYGYLGYVKDRFPLCKVLGSVDKPNEFPFSVQLVEIEVEYSFGVKLWLLSQGSILKVTSPREIQCDIAQTLTQTLARYSENIDED